MSAKIKRSDLSFALKIHREEVPWEHQERAVYTVEALREEMTERLSPPPVSNSSEKPADN